MTMEPRRRAAIAAARAPGNTRRIPDDTGGMIRATLAAMTLTALAGCSSDPAAAPAAVSQPVSASLTVTTTATSSTSGNRSALLVQVDEAAEKAGVATPYLSQSVGAFVLMACDHLDAAPAGERKDTVWAFVMEFAPDADDALALGVPIACPQYASLVKNLSG